MDRDHDFMLLGCPPSAALPFFFQIQSGQADCLHGCGEDITRVECSKVWPQCAQGQPPPIPRELSEEGCKLTRCNGRAAFWCAMFAQASEEGRVA